MQDFIRIGGEIVSAPLNENFRRLLNAIDIATTNLVFPDENAVVDTLDDMHAIKDPANAQTCYVISSGELYRYTKKNNKWVKIADFGQTFRQGFLNSGAVVLEDKIKLKSGSKQILIMPSMLVYFKNKPGDAKYLKGMYKIPKKELNISSFTNGADAYSIVVDYTRTYSLINGMPSTDDPNHIFIGTILVDNDNNVVGSFIYTLPDMAYTADRGHFMLNGGEATGCNLLPAETKNGKVNRASGYYYDEGVNFPIGQTDNYPIDTDNGSNYDLKAFEEITPVTKLYYMTPTNPLSNNITAMDRLICDKYWDGTNLLPVPEGYFTIQQHLITPNGEDIILYGTELYNSITDAISNLNSTYGISMDFPHVEVTRIVIGNFPLNTSDSDKCRFYTLGRLSQVGTISPEFADNMFRIYSGDANDITPSSFRFDLVDLQAEDYEGLYSLDILPSNVTRDVFSLDKKYITDTNSQSATKTLTGKRTYGVGTSGYKIADDEDLKYIRARLDDIEKEIWELPQSNRQRYEQSLRYRLFHAEDRLDDMDNLLADHETRIDYVEKYKVHKNTTVNGYKLGDTTAKNEAKGIVLKTGDIDEGNGLGSSTNLWYTEARVSKNVDVQKGSKHADIKSKSDNANNHVKVNPHNLSTDDINILTDTTKIFVTPEEERRIRSDRLPENTKAELASLDNRKIEDVGIDLQTGNSNKPGSTITHLGDVKNLKFYADGVDISIDPTGETAIIDCIGQYDDTLFMFKKDYATLSLAYPELYKGYVDNAVNARFASAINGIEAAKANQYYGTNKDAKAGIYDLPVYVSTASGTDFSTVDQVSFIPMNDTVTLDMLVPSLRDTINHNYHTVLDSGVKISDEVNKINFGNNMKVTYNDHTVTINVPDSISGGGGGTIESKFANLDDVNVTYSGNAGKKLGINPTGTGVCILDEPPLENYMLKAVYVDPNNIYQVRKAASADNATYATSANNAAHVNDKVVDDSKKTDAVLWTASKIISNTSAQIRAEGVNTYSGTSVPSSSLGKDGDIYVLLG